jgi:hypothetical protein
MISTIQSASKLAKVAVLVLCLSFVLNIKAFSSSSRVFSVLKSSTSALYQQVTDDDDDEPKPFFFTGEPRSEVENKELRRVFLGAESLRSSSLGQTEEPLIETPEVGGRMINFESERENLERLFRL